MVITKKVVNKPQQEEKKKEIRRTAAYARVSTESIEQGESYDSQVSYYKNLIERDTLCLLDEPENSLSPENQLVLADFLTESVRYCGNQLVISTHSPFLLALPGAKIIDLDDHFMV